MIALIQRVNRSSVTVDEKIIGEIGKGLTVLLGIEEADGDDDIDWLIRKITNLRIFDDENGVMNKSLIDINGEALVISQFTLHASTKKGNRPGYSRAAPPAIAEPLYERFVTRFKEAFDGQVATGEFGAYMVVDIENDGPVTIHMDTKNKI